MNLKNLVYTGNFSNNNAQLVFFFNVAAHTNLKKTSSAQLNIQNYFNEVLNCYSEIKTK